MKLSTILSLRCPVCEKGKIFHSYFDTPERCPSCGFYFMRENGYFLPHVAIGYSLIVTVTLSIWPLLKYGLGITSDAILLTTMILTGLVFGLWSIRYAKMLWLALDLTIHPSVLEDFQARGRTDGNNGQHAADGSDDGKTSYTQCRPDGRHESAATELRNENVG